MAVEPNTSAEGTVVYVIMNVFNEYTHCMYAYLNNIHIGYAVLVGIY